MFEGAYGPELGHRRFRKVLQVVIPLAVVGVVLALVIGDWHLVKSAYQEVSDWISPLVTHQGPSQPSGGAQRCVITGGENKGIQIQNCP